MTMPRPEIDYNLIQEYNNGIKSSELSNNPHNNPYYYYRLGLTNYHLYKFNEAGAAFDAYLKLIPDNLLAIYMQARTYIQLNLRDKAEENFNKLIQIAPNYYYAHYLRGIGLLNLQRYEESIIALDRCLQLNHYYDAYVYKGWALIALNKYPEADKIFKYAIEHSLNSTFTQFNYGHALYAMKHYDKAVNQFNETIASVNGSYYPSYYKMGLVLLAQGKTEAAENYFRKCIEIAPKDFNAYYDFAYGLSLLEKDQECIEACKKTLEFCPGHPYAVALKNQIAEKLKLNHDEEMNEYQQAFITLLASYKNTHESSSLEEFNNLVDPIRGQTEKIKWLFDILLRQYNEILFKVGRALYRCRVEIENANDDKSETNILEKLLWPGKNVDELNNVDELYRLLYHLEDRREMLINLCDTPEKENECLNLTSRNDILKTQNKYLKQMDDDLLESAYQGNFEIFRHSLVNGANVNQWKDNWGQAIHFLIRERGLQHKNPNDVIKLFHYLLKSGDELEKQNGTKRNLDGHHWLENTKPIKGILNFAYFDLALLLCASGYDIPETQEYFQNGLWYGSINPIIQKYLVKEMNKEDGIINKKALRDAYVFYKAIEAGESPSAENINHDCLLWLVCVLGDLKPLEYLPNLNVNINRVIPYCHFSPLMMAVHCGNDKVVSFLLSRGAKIDLPFAYIDPNPDTLPDVSNGTNAPNDPADLMVLAISRQSWLVAQTLINAGMNASEWQKQKIQDGLNKNNLAEEKNSMLHNNISNADNDKILKLENLVVDLVKKMQDLEENLKIEKQHHEQEKEQLINELKTQIKKQAADEALLEGAKLGDEKRIEAALVLHANIKAKNEKGQTAFHVALLNNHKKTAKLILDKEPSLFRITDNEGLTAIQQIAKEGNHEMLEWLYHEGKLTDELEMFNQVYSVARIDTQLYLANKKLIESSKQQQSVEIVEGKVEGVRDALLKHADINVKASDGDTALHKAICYKYIEVTKLLIEKGADPTIPDKLNQTALDVAVSVRDIKFISIVAIAVLKHAEKETESNIRNKLYHTVLDVANNTKDINLISTVATALLKQVESETDPVFRNKLHHSVLDVANGTKDINLITTVATTMLQHTAKETDSGIRNTLNLAVLFAASYTQDINLITTVATTILQHAEKETNSTIRNNFNITVLDVVKSTKDENLISTIASTILQHVACYGRQENIAAILNEGAVLTSKNALGQTPLHLAVLSKNTEVIKFLIMKYAEEKINIDTLLDNNKKSPIDLAIQSGDTIETKRGTQRLFVYMGQKYGAYKEDIKYLTKQPNLSNSVHSFVASVGKDESTVNKIQNSNNNSVQPEDTQLNIKKFS